MMILEDYKYIRLYFSILFHLSNYTRVYLEIPKNWQTFGPDLVIRKAPASFKDGQPVPYLP